MVISEAYGKTNGAVPEPTPALSRQIIGRRGISRWGRWIQEEYLSELKPWSRQAKIILEMLDDAIIGTLLDAIKSPLLAADFDVTPASDSEADQRAAEFLWQSMQGLDNQTWRSHVRDMLESVEFGFSVGEFVMDKKPDGRLWLKNIEPRAQETLYGWEFDENDRATAFLQGSFMGLTPISGIISIPLWKCLHITFRGRKGTPQGKSLLRSIYRTWRFLKNLENFEAIGVERDIGGMPIFTLPEEPLTSDDIDTVKQEAEALRMDESMYLILPNGLEVNPYSSGSKAYNTREIITAKQKEILMRFYAQFLYLGMDNVGTQALVKGSQDFFSIGVKSIQQEMLESWQQQLVPFIFKWSPIAGMTVTNGRTQYPTITWGDPGKIDISALLDAMQSGIQNNVLTPTRNDEEKLRDILDLPDLPEGVGEGDRTLTPQPTAGLPPMGYADVGWTQVGDLRPLTPTGSRQISEVNVLANRYQKELVTVYKEWSDDAAKALQKVARNPAKAADVIVQQTDKLATKLTQLGQRHITFATDLPLPGSIGQWTGRPELTELATQRIARNEQFIQRSLKPAVERRMASLVPELGTITGKGSVLARTDVISNSLQGMTSRVASYSGAVVETATATEMQAARLENTSRLAKGEPALKARWVLDPRAEHCQANPARGSYGCPDLAGDYDSVDALPTHPAANVSCMSRCRCSLMMNIDGKWMRFRGHH